MGQNPLAVARKAVLV